MSAGVVEAANRAVRSAYDHDGISPDGKGQIRADVGELRLESDRQPRPGEDLFDIELEDVLVPIQSARQGVSRDWL